jgi:hypothetical protein
MYLSRGSYAALTFHAVSLFAEAGECGTDRAAPWSTDLNRSEASPKLIRTCSQGHRLERIGVEEEGDRCHGYSQGTPRMLAGVPTCVLTLQSHWQVSSECGMLLASSGAVAHRSIHMPGAEASMSGPTSDERRGRLASVFREFGERECRGYSPLYERLSLGVAEEPALLDLAATTRPGQPVPNMLLGAVHYLLMRGEGHPLAAYFPDLTAPRPPAPGDPMPAFRDFCAEHEDELRALLATRLVQTNEVRRCACLLPAFALAERAAGGRPLALVEVGASAGLNLLWDRYAFDYGAPGQLGDPASPVRITCAVRGPHAPPLPAAMPRVDWRLGIDLHPVDVLDPEAVLWLRALIWPEHLDRTATLDGAVAVARQAPPRIVAGDALALLPAALQEAPAEALLCVYHSVTTNQFTPAERHRWRELLAAAGTRRELCHLSIEYHRGRPRPTLDFGHYRPGVAVEAERVLAVCQPHGAWIEWQGAEARM